MNKPIDGRLKNAPKGHYVTRDFTYDEDGKKHYLPTRAERRAKKRNNSKKLKRLSK